MIAIDSTTTDLATLELPATNPFEIDFNDVADSRPFFPRIQLAVRILDLEFKPSSTSKPMWTIKYELAAPEKADVCVLDSKKQFVPDPITGQPTRRNQVISGIQNTEYWVLQAPNSSLELAKALIQLLGLPSKMDVSKVDKALFVGRAFDVVFGSKWELVKDKVTKVIELEPDGSQKRQLKYSIYNFKGRRTDLDVIAAVQ